MMTLIISGHYDRGQRDTVAAPGAVIVIVLQNHNGNARLGTTLGASNKCFASSHNLLSFLLRAFV